MTGQIIENIIRGQNALFKQQMTVSADVKMNRNFVLFVIAYEIVGALEILLANFFFNNQNKIAVVSDVWVIQIH